MQPIFDNLLNKRVNKLKLFATFLIVVIGLAIGFSIASNNLRIFIISSASLAILLLLSVRITLRNAKSHLFRVLLLTIACSFLAFSIGFRGITVLEVAIIIIFCLIMLLKMSRLLKGSLTPQECLILIFASMYGAGGFITMILTSFNISPWIKACIMPLLILFSSFSLIIKFKQIEASWLASRLSILGFISLILFGIYTGYANRIPGTEGSDQLTVALDIAGIQFESYATWFGATTAMILPLFLISGLHVPTLKHRWFSYLTIIVCIYFYRLAGTRAGGIGIGISFLLIVGLVSFTLKRLRRNLLTTIFFLAIFSAFIILTNFQVPSEIERSFRSLIDYGIDTPNLRHRINLLTDAYGSLVQNPWGIGFNTLWFQYSIDEVTFFSWSANGVGLIGVMGFWGMCIVLIKGFIHGLFNKDENVKLCSVVGISTMVGTFIGAFGNDQILWRPQTTLPFWLIIAASFKGTELQGNEEKVKGCVDSGRLVNKIVFQEVVP